MNFIFGVDMKLSYFICLIVLIIPCWISYSEENPECLSFNLNTIERFTAATSDVKGKKGQDTRIPGKTVLSPRQKASVSLGVSGGVFLLTGVGLLTGSLVYSDYIEKNEKVYDKYKTGKDISRGLFYGSMGVFGASAVTLTVCIPLSIQPKNKIVPKDNTQKSVNVQKKDNGNQKNSQKNDTDKNKDDAKLKKDSSLTKDDAKKKKDGSIIKKDNDKNKADKNKNKDLKTNKKK
jgi:hypothetical protein